MMLPLLWLFPARKFGGDLQAIGKEVVEVLHPVVHEVPLRPIGDASAEGV